MSEDEKSLPQPSNVTIRHRTSGAEKSAFFEGFPGGDRSPFVQLRIGYSGCYNFSLNTGWMEHKRSETPDWFVADADLEKLRDYARQEKRKFTAMPRHLPAQKPRRPRKGGEIHPAQVGMFKP